MFIREQEGFGCNKRAMYHENRLVVCLSPAFRIGNWTASIHE